MSGTKWTCACAAGTIQPSNPRAAPATATSALACAKAVDVDMRRHCRCTWTPPCALWCQRAAPSTQHTHGMAWRLTLLARPGMEVVVCPTQTGTWLVRSCTSGLSATSRRTYSKFTLHSHTHTHTRRRRAWWLLPLIACLLHRTSGSDALKLSNGRQHQPSPLPPRPPPPRPCAPDYPTGSHAKKYPPKLAQPPF